MIEFTAIDFETANKYANSACSVAIVQMQGTICVQETYTLIKPPFMVFETPNVQIHGITPQQVMHENKFDTLWPTLAPQLDKYIVVAHYAAFDMRVLRSLLKTYQLPKPTLRYMCTVELSRRVWPHLKNHKLDTLADMLGISFQHHQALDDARTCAKILCAAIEKVGAQSIEELVYHTGISLKKL
ncbi:MULTISPECIES: 3'-5' exonuclease [Megasphaera]|uniref:DNA polymerase III, epsilon subunit domain protein n=1 Tax=Megasphaera hutchinsoni TaxID=1588748 RepID=A0A134CEE4_9FIRM|nr:MULTISPECIES: 3'-5' exonuclease [Megasphaera]EGS32149.1 exonuclease [Megasphaera sp. UPII 135-E]KXB90540.1 DNA polymerase III, epsilon subunit domain protein [Megasphaera hutchinsoni]MUP48847.1 exonuclease [Veillonellaceae bacterium M2-8]